MLHQPSTSNAIATNHVTRKVLQYFYKLNKGIRANPLKLLEAISPIYSSLTSIHNQAAMQLC